MDTFLRSEFDTPAIFEAEEEDEGYNFRTGAFDYNDHMPTIQEEVSTALLYI